MCDWFVDSKLSICFEEDKIKSILFVSVKSKVQGNLNIEYKDIKIKQHLEVKYLVDRLHFGLNLVRGSYGLKSVELNRWKTKISLP